MEWSQTSSHELEEFEGFLRELGEADAQMAGWDGVEELESWKAQQLEIARASIVPVELDPTTPKGFAELVKKLRHQHPGRTVRKRDVRDAVGCVCA